VDALFWATDAEPKDFFDLEITVQDRVDAARLHGKENVLFAILWIINILLVAMTVALFWPDARESIFNGIWSAFEYLTIPAIALFLAFRFVFLPRHVRSTYAKIPLAQLVWRIALHPEGIETKSSRHHEMLRWSDFIGWRTNAKVTIVYFTHSRYLVFPARLASAGFPMDEFKAILERELGEPKRPQYWSL